MGDFIAKSVASGVITEFPSTPVELAATLAAGQYDLKPIGGPTVRVTVLDVQNTAIPTVSGSATPGSTLTGTTGTWTGVLDATTPYEFRWLDITATETVIHGASSSSFDVPASGYESKNLAYEVRAQNARGQWTGWARSATISIANLSFNITDAEWNWAEDPDDAETRQGYATLTLLADLPAGKRPRFYRGPNAAGNPAQTGWMTGSGRNWTFDPANGVGLGVRDYGVIYMQTDDGAGNPVGPITQISSVKYFDASNVPSKPGTHTAVAGTVATGDVVIDPNNTPPAANGRAITGYGYSVDGGAVIALSGGTAVTARTVTIGGTVAVAVRVHAQNINGWSVGSDPVTVTPPVITAGTNTSAPYFDANGYAGGAARAVAGIWTGNPTITTTIEASNDGTTGWATYANAIVDDIWDAGLAGKYVRIKEVPSIGTTAYSAVFGPIGPAYTYVLSLSNNNNYASHTVTPPFMGTTFDNGFYLGGVAYYNGTIWDAGSQAIISLGNGSTTAYEISVCGNSVRARSNGGTPFASLNTPVTPGWYICVVHVKKVGSTKTIRFLRNDEEAPSGTNTTTSGSYTLSGAEWNLLRIGQLAASSATNGGSNFTIDHVFWGKGDPTDLVAWMYNSGKIRKADEYNFGADVLGCTLEGMIDLFKTGSATFNEATDLIDKIGPYDTWSMTAPNGSFSWAARKPSFIKPLSDPLPIPIAYLSPAFGTTDDIFSIESGKFGGTASTAAWVTAKPYGVNQRVTQGGTTYRCLVAHTSGTFATDLTNGNWGVFSITVNSLTHSVLGDIRGSLVGYAFTCNTAGTITGNVTLNGTSVAIQCEVLAARTIPASPQYATSWGGNGLVAAIEPYPTPAGTATTFASVAALQTALSSLTAGSTLIVDDLNDLNGATLTIPQRDYGGATVICKNWEGFKCLEIILSSVSNLNLVGFAARNRIYGLSVGAGVSIDHCRTAKIDVSGSNELTSTFRFTNHLCWEAASGIANGYSRFNRFSRLTGLSWIMAGMDDAVAVFQLYKIGTVLFDRWYAAPGQYTGTTHPDIMQITATSSLGYTGGYWRNGYAVHKISGGGKPFQGIFLTDNVMRDLMIKNVIIDPSNTNSLSINGCQWNVRVENVTVSSLSAITSGYQDSGYIGNCVMGSVGPRGGSTMLQTASLGYETGNLSLSGSSLVATDLWPQSATYPGYWRAYANPNAGYETRGAASFVAELEAKRVAMGI